MTTQPPAWWQSRAFVLAVVLAAIMPLLWPPVPPLVDLPGHIGRYRILADAGCGPLGQHYAIAWAPIGNLGIDLLVLALHPLIDVEPAAKLIVLGIPLATMMAMLWLGHTVHGRIPPAIGFALPLAYGYPFQLGFVNFTLSAALAIAALALWIGLAKSRPRWVRIAGFAPVACIVWLCHSFGWAMLGLFILGAEWRICVLAGQTRYRAAASAALACLPMALPIVPMLLGHAPMAGATGDWFDGAAKAQFVVSILRERWKWWDVVGAATLYMVIWAAIRSSRLRIDPLLGIPAAFGIGAFLLMPRLLQGGAYGDMRLLPYALALALIGICGADEAPNPSSRLAIGGAAFLVLRTLGTTIAFILFARTQGADLQAIHALRPGGATLVLVREPGSAHWSGPRETHLAGLAIARARVFTNEQWTIGGQQPIRSLHPQAAPFDRDPSQLVYAKGSIKGSTDFDDAIARFDRCTFDSVWTIGFPAGRAHATDLRLAWHDDRSAVYRVAAHRCLSAG